MSNRIVPGTELQKLLSRSQLPALPRSAVRLIQLSQDVRNGPREIAGPIESDPALAAQVLRFANSSYFGFAHEISTIRQALSLVGVRVVMNFVLWNAVFSSIPTPKCGPVDLARIWLDALRRALFARGAAKALGAQDAEEAFSAALLQDVAVPLLAQNVPQIYARLFEERSHTAVRLSALERREFGWTHAEAGGIVCRAWKLPDRLAMLIEKHAEIARDASAAGMDPAVAAVALSGLLPSVVDEAWAERESFESLYARLVPSTGPEISQLFAAVDQQFAELAAVLSLQDGGRPLSGFCEA